MNARNTFSAPKTQTRRTGEAGQWWKAWVLLTGLGAIVLGWMGFPHGQQPAKGVVSPQVSISADNEPVLRVDPIDSRIDRQTGVLTLPAMPQKPVFQAPVTRTRRS